jgi:hypothetical protein
MTPDMTPRSQRRLWGLLAVAGLALVFLATLVPTSDPDTGTFHWCLVCGDLGLSDAIANVALFFPLAVGLYGAGVPGRKTVVALFLLSTAIELAQLRIPGRESALGDVVSNSLGALLGVGSLFWWRTRRRSGLAAAAAASLALAVMVCSGLVLRPHFPATVYYGQWTAELGQFEWYRGRVLSAEIGGMPLPDARLERSPAVRERLEAGDALRVRAVAGARPLRLAPIFSIADDHARGILLIGADRNDLVLQVTTSATDLRLQQPDLRWRDVLAGVAPGDSLSIAASRTPAGYCLALNGRERCGVAFAAGEAWGLVQPLPHLGSGASAGIDMLYLAMLGLPFGLLVPRRVWGYAMAGLLLAGAVVLPPLVGMAPTPALQVIGLALGMLAGVLIPVGAEGGAPQRSNDVALA